jgi:hypothetical protein
VSLDEVPAAPAVTRLEDTDVVAEREQLTRDPAEEVRVAVVPVGDERVVEERDLHAATLRNVAACVYAAR